MEDYKNILDEIYRGKIKPVSRTEIKAVKEEDGVYFDLPCGKKDCVAMIWAEKRIALLSEEQWERISKSLVRAGEDTPALRKMARFLGITARFLEYEEGKGFRVPMLLFHSLGDGDRWEYLEAGAGERPFGYITAGSRSGDVLK